MPASRPVWTGGQFSLLRAQAALAALVAVLLTRPIPESGTWVALAVCLLILTGWQTRLVCLITAMWQPWPYWSHALLVFAYFPDAPYGSWSRRGQLNPGTDWNVSPGAVLLASLAVGHLLWLKPANWDWSWVVSLASCGLAALAPGFLPVPTGQKETIFYDGNCGLCHRVVRFVLSEDPWGERFEFAPLDSEAFRNAIPADELGRLPDSVVILSHGRLLTKSTAVLHLCSRLGGYWRLISWAGHLIPSAWRDMAYDGVAAVRHRLFAKPSDVCPLLPAPLRSRFRT
jgi:predicted DCC family thiol-disulfide oxidoreductase YuxK